ncbi:hypothetical protein PUV47_00895 [Pseudovibrio exalbescens]|nr:hypothetical protein [Pseudovibrio exalbescens]MDD7908462.1 hypothetical protein [Pseudovibrio exalbescens]
MKNMDGAHQTEQSSSIGVWVVLPKAASESLCFRTISKGARARGGSRQG